MIKGISYLSFENGLEGTHPIDLAIKEAKFHGFSALNWQYRIKAYLLPQPLNMNAKKFDNKSMIPDFLLTVWQAE